MKDKTEMHAWKLKGLFEEETRFRNLLIHNKLQGAYGAETTFTNCTFQDCEIKGCFFDGATFKNCSFYGCDIAAVDFSNCIFEDCTFTSRFDMCDFTDATFINCSLRRGYMRCCTIDDTAFTNVTFDGIWAGKLHIAKPAKFENATYTMGGARCDEVEIAKKNFFKEFGMEVA